MYRYQATSLPGFVQQLAVAYVGHGYFFYVTGAVPEGKDPTAVDRKLLARYGIDVSRWARARRKEAGKANLQYLRFGRLFVLLATHGEHPFFAAEAASIRDVRRAPLKVGGYAVSHRGGHPHVRIEQGEYKRLKAYLLGLAAHRSAERLRAELRRIPYEPYAPVRRQLLAILRAVNRARGVAGFETLPNTALRLRRRIYRPFAPIKVSELAASPGPAGAGRA